MPAFDAHSPSAPLLSDLVFCRGYLLSAIRLDSPPSFINVPLPNGMHFYHHPLLPISIARDENSWILFAGQAIDVVRNTYDRQSITEHLNRCLMQTEEAFFDALDLLSGRFVLVYSLRGRVKVLHDACGVKAVFYSSDKPIVASHASLVEQYVKSGISGVQEERVDGAKYQYGYPGHATPFRDVHILTPNTLLEFPSQKVQRYFPREDLTRSTVEEATPLVASAMKTQVKALSHSPCKLLTSLTAGLDSRVSLATMRGSFGAIDFFTYHKQGTQVHEIDVGVSKHLAKIYNLNHRIIDIDVPPALSHELAGVSKILQKNTYLSHARNLAFLYMKTFGDQPILHLRSNLGEIGRAFYKRKENASPLDPLGMTRLYSADLVKVAPVEDAFRKFYEVSNFSNIRNYDSYDMFYWEFRMGSWHSQLVIESDIAFETHILFNARYILKLLLSVPFEDRKNSTLFSRIIRENLPEIDEVPINPRSWP